MKQNNSIFTRVLALVLCMLMCAGVLTACFQMPEFNPVLNSNGVPTPDSTTGGVGENTPNEDPVDPEEPVDPNVIFSASTTVDANNLILGALTNDVVIGGEGATALVPADVVLETGASSLALTLKNVEENDVDFGDAELLNNLDVHISGIAANNTVPMTVALGAILEAGLGATELKLYHIENGTPVLMTRVASASDFAIHNQYVYNEETGEVTIYVASFSVFAMVKAEADVLTAETEPDISWYTENTEADEFTLDSAADFIGFRNLVDEGVTFAGKTVKLGVDIDLNKINFDPIGYGYTYNKDSDTAFMGTFDGQGHIIYNLYEQGWDLENATGKDYTYSTAGAGLFASIEGTVDSPAVIKNLVVSGADIVMECVDMGIVVGYAQGVCHFENIIVTNSTIGNYQRATGGVVGEVCYGPYGVEHNNENFSHTFKNIIVDSSVTVGSLWGDFDNLNGGVIGGKWGNATVKMEDVTVAVTLDAYSDVTSAYQWYAYRRSGMLIGHTEQNSPKKAETADAPFLVCENVKVYYGDWVNYTYCQFENTNNPGYRYPWVRVQVGLNNGAYSNPRYGHPVDVDGKTVETAEHTHAEGDGCNVLIKFHQLYGGGQGVYGKADHAGVTVVDKNTTTLYIKTNATNVKLFYWYDTTWTNVVDGIELVGQDGTFIANIPAYAQGFKLVVDGVESEDFVLANYADGETITLGQAPCTHENTTTTTVNATCTVAGSTTVTCDDCKVTISVTEIHTIDHSYNAVVTNPTCTEAGYTTYTCACGDTYTDNETAALDHDWSKDPYNCSRTGCGEKADTKTIYFYNNWNWTTPQFSFSGHTLNMTDKKVEGSYATYTIELPTYVEKFTVHGGNDTSIEIPNDENLVAGTTYSMLYKNEQNQLVATVKVSLKPNNDWKKDNAWFAAYVWIDTKTDAWVKLTDANSDGIYEGYVPAGYNNIIFARMKNSISSTSTSSYKFDNAWNQTIDLTIPSNGDNLFTVTALYENKLYLKPNDNWKVDGARFAAYFFGNGEKWVSMTDSNGDGIYEVEVPSGFTMVIFCRMNPNASANNWNNKWNQTGDLSIPANGSNNLFEIPYGAWDGSTNNWISIIQNKYTGNWSTK